MPETMKGRRMNDGKKRSIGVTVWAVLFIFGGLMNASSIAGIMFYQQPMQFTHDTYKQSFSHLHPDKDLDELLNREDVKQMILIQNKISSELYDNTSLTLWCVVNTVYGITLFIIGIGLLGLKEWSRKATLIFHIVLVPPYIVASEIYILRAVKIIMTHIPQLKVVSSLVPIMLGIQIIFTITMLIIIIYYFTRPKVKEQFKKVDEITT